MKSLLDPKLNIRMHIMKKWKSKSSFFIFLQPSINKKQTLSRQVLVAYTWDNEKKKLSTLFSLFYSPTFTKCLSLWIAEPVFLFSKRSFYSHLHIGFCVVLDIRLLNNCELWPKWINNFPSISSFLYHCRAMYTQHVGDIMSYGAGIQMVVSCICPLQHVDKLGAIVGVLWCSVLSSSALFLSLCYLIQILSIMHIVVT